MKKIYGLLLAFFALPILSMAQTPSSPPFISGAPLAPSVRGAILDTCGTDTLAYLDTKTTAMIGVTMNVPSEFYGYAQYYDAPQEVTVHGFNFYAGVNSVDPMDTAVVTCGIYTANTDSTPNTLLSSVNVTIGNTYNPNLPSQMLVTVTFSSPVVVNQPYLVSLQTNTLESLGVLTDDYNNGDGQDERLGFWRWTGDSVWYASNEFFAWDVDFLLNPIVEYELWTAYTPTSNAICAGDSICMSVDSISPIYYSRMYNQNALNGITENGFSWLWNDGTPNSAFGDTCHTYANAGSFMPRLATNLIGWTTNCTLNNFDSVEVSTTPILSFFSVGNEWTHDFVETITNDFDTIWWDYGDGMQGFGSNPSHTYSDTGTYNVCLHAMNACGWDSICMPVDVMCTPPSADFTSSVDTVDVAFTDVSVGNNITSWEWDFGDTNTSTLQNPTHTYAASGNYLVCLIVTDACSSDTFCAPVNVIGLSVENIFAEGAVSLFPTPADEIVTLRVNLPKSVSIQLEIFDVTGRLVEKTDLGSTGNLNKNIQIGHLQAGHYFVKLTTLEGNTTLPFIKK